MLVYKKNKDCGINFPCTNVKNHDNVSFKGSFSQFTMILDELN